MARMTLHREYSTEEHRIARLIVDKVSAAGSVDTAAVLADMVGVSRKRLYSIMPLAATKARDRFPGHALMASQKGTHYVYMITSDADIITMVVENVMKRVATTVKRLDDDVDPLRVLGLTDLGSLAMINTTETALSALKPDLMDAIFRENANNRKQKQILPPWQPEV